MKRIDLIIAVVLCLNLIASCAYLIHSLLHPPVETPDTLTAVPYSQALTLVEEGHVSEVTITGSDLILTPSPLGLSSSELNEGEAWASRVSLSVEPLQERLLAADVAYTSHPEPFDLTILFIVAICFLLLAVIAFIGLLLLNRKLNKPKAEAQLVQNVSTRFDDVAGCDAAKQDLTEIVTFLKHPDKFTQAGAKIPKGVLLHGPPGTGKTLLARATAGESGVPFIRASGSQFTGRFVGQGVERVSHLFQRAAKLAPCIVFIDEFDALARARQGGTTGAEREFEQTLNELLIQMDGFTKDRGIVVIAATNQFSSLDEAALRRFPRRIFVGRPNLASREAILRVLSRGRRMAEDVDYARLAAMTAGLSGSGLEDILNEGVLISLREEAPAVTTNHLIQAFEVQMLGHKDVTTRLTPEDRRRVAVHEAGHAIIIAALRGHADIRRISIVPTTQGALGYNLTISEGQTDLPLRTPQDFLDDVCVLLGGRVAERSVLQSVSTGAADDLRRANRILWRYIMEFGFSESLPDRTFLKDLGGTMNPKASKELEKLLAQSNARASHLLETNQHVLDMLIEALQAHEELSGEALSEILCKVASTQPNAD